MLNSLDPDPSYLQKLSADNKSPLARKKLYNHNNSDMLDDKNIKEYEIAIRCQCSSLCMLFFFMIVLLSADFFQN